jgi:hypothetical protein
MSKIALSALILLAACTDSSVDSNEQARRAYLGLDKSVSKSIQLGFDGFNSATSANISPQMVAGDAGGTLTITGQVDQGSSANKNMRLYVGMVKYTDGKVKVNSNGDTVSVTYDTSTTQTAQPYLQLALKGIPTGTLTGTLTGDYTMSGDLKGTITLDLTISGSLMAGTGGNMVERVPGTTTVTGTAVNSSGGMYMINVTI